MEIHLKRVKEKFNFEAQDVNGHSVLLDANPSIGGEGNGFRPMEMLLIGLGGCSGIDVVNVLEKQRQKIEDIAIKITSTRFEGEIPSLFKDIHVQFILKGEIDEAKLTKALDLTFEKYCSVAHVLNKTAQITFSYLLNK